MNVSIQRSIRLFSIISVMTFSVPFLASMANAQTAASNSKMRWLQQQLDALPDVRAAQQKRDAWLARANANTQPLYNPELGSSYEREGEQDNYQVSLSQKIDWWDQQGSREQQSEFLHVQAEQNYRRSYQQILKNALSAFVNWQAAKQRYELALEQEQQLDQLISLVKDRSANGDLGQIDVELTLLSLSQTLADTAQAVAAYQTAENQVRQWLPNWSPNTVVLDDVFWQKSMALISEPTTSFDKNDEALLQRLPELRIAKAEWKIQQANAETVRRSNKAEPTIGITAGQNGSTDVVGINLSIPLNVRNNYHSVNQAALQDALSAESNYLAKHRQLSYQLNSSRALATQYRKQQQRWKKLMQDSRASSGQLLKRQWQAGDLGTSQYLQALKQRIEGIQAGVTLNEESQIATINWLYNSGQINRIYTF